MPVLGSMPPAALPSPAACLQKGGRAATVSNHDRGFGVPAGTHTAAAACLLVAAADGRACQSVQAERQLEGDVLATPSSLTAGNTAHRPQPQEQESRLREAQRTCHSLQEEDALQPLLLTHAPVGAVASQQVKTSAHQLH